MHLVLELFPVHGLSETVIDLVRECWLFLEQTVAGLECSCGESEKDSYFRCTPTVEGECTCIPAQWKCDHDVDCDLGDDEADCGKQHILSLCCHFCLQLSWPKTIKIAGHTSVLLTRLLLMSLHSIKHSVSSALIHKLPSLFVFSDASLLYRLVLKIFAFVISVFLQTFAPSSAFNVSASH